MKPNHVPPTEMGKQRQAWFEKHIKSGISFEQTLRLNDEALRLFPPAEEERRLKTESLMAMPEFVL